MAFSISFLSEDEYPYFPDNREITFGEIRIGEYQEIFEANLSYWTRTEYKYHWTNALKRIIMGYKNSCLITNLYDPIKANYLVWWPLYRYGKIVYVQNQLVMLKSLQKDFTPNDPYRFVKNRKTINEDGLLISEWVTSVDSLDEFLNTG